MAKIKEFIMTTFMCTCLPWGVRLSSCNLAIATGVHVSKRIKPKTFILMNLNFVCFPIYLIEFPHFAPYDITGKIT